jgi:hypothetical protein
MNNKDWTGNIKSTYVTLGASNHTKEIREENDYYATDPIAAKLLIDCVILNKNIWECSCGSGHLSKIFIDNGFNVKSTDLIDRGFGESGIDFLSCTEKFNGDIVTNPPYKYAVNFIKKALELISTGNKVCMFLKLQFLESKNRKKLFLSNPPHTIYVSSNRIMCAKNAEFDNLKKSGGSAIAYAWYIWEKGFQGTTSIKWIN